MITSPGEKTKKKSQREERKKGSSFSMKSFGSDWNSLPMHEYRNWNVLPIDQHERLSGKQNQILPARLATYCNGRPARIPIEENRPGIKTSRNECWSMQKRETSCTLCVSYYISSKENCPVTHPSLFLLLFLFSSFLSDTQIRYKPVQKTLCWCEFCLILIGLMMRSTKVIKYTATHKHSKLAIDFIRL